MFLAVLVAVAAVLCAAAAICAGLEDFDADLYDF
jgi:hypothetical protein